MTGTTIRKQLIFWGLTLLLLTPLIVANFLFFPFITGKNFFFRIVIEILAALWLSKSIIDTSWRPKKGILLTALAGLTAAVLISTFFSIDPYRSFWSNFERMEGAITYIHLFFLFLIMTSVITHTKDWRKFWIANTAVSMLIAVFAFLQIAGEYPVHQGSTRLDATLGNASYLAVYMLLAIFITALLWIQDKKNTILQYIYPLIMLIQMFVLYKTGTRGAILGLIFGLALACVFFLLRGKEYPRARGYALGILALIIVGGGVLMSFRDSAVVQESPVLSRFANISLTDRTVISRIAIWQMSWEGFTEKPVFGWGLENFGTVFNKFYRPELWTAEPWFDRSHNVFLDWLTLTGLVGFTFYVSLYGSLFYLLWNRRSVFTIGERVLLTALVAAYLVQNIFIFDNIVSLILFISLLAYIHVRSTEHNEHLWPTKKIKIDPMWSGSAAALIMVVVLYFASIQPLIAAAELIVALQPHQEGIAVNARAFESVLARNTFATGEASEQLVAFSQRIFSEPSAPQDVKQQIFKFTSEHVEKQIADTPYDARLKLFYGSMLGNIGQVQASERYLKEALALSPKKQLTMFQLGSLYMASGRPNEALAIAKEAFELDESFLEARKVYALTAYLIGKKDLMQEIIAPVYKDGVVPDARFATVYMREGKLAQAAGVYEAIDKDPELTMDNQDRLLLSSLYVRLGKIDKALEQLNIVKEADPELVPNSAVLESEIRAGRNPFRVQ